MAYRKSNESVVEKTKEDDGTHHHATNETKGPAGPQDGVNLGHKDGSQSPSPASRCCQPAHVDALQTATNVTDVSLKSDQSWIKFSLTWGVGPRILEYNV